MHTSHPDGTLAPMTDDLKHHLQRYLQTAREALLWKLDGLGEYDLRRPLTPTGTNLLGLVKHCAATDVEYFGLCFDRPFPDPPAWFPLIETVPNIEMWATADETADSITGLYKRVWDHSNATIDALDLDSEGTVPWWPEERRTVTLGQILVHMIAETNRHAGHADIVRETIDGAAGLNERNSNLPPADQFDWPAYRDQVEQAARTAAGE
ncbi:putative damage-inducible protein DinB [Glycomyces artemisiae]|uniref:Putative damage-inducible protein DinB n=2 Tax=Glycomyces artemisiae TaxID=1076443 RepID=A0A2T0UGG0_9ACTN|nr:putative damage-inducible protein DinB [Glycomyces artemisiae]